MKGTGVRPYAPPAILFLITYYLLLVTCHLSLVTYYLLLVQRQRNGKCDSVLCRVLRLQAASVLEDDDLGGG